MVEQVIAPGAAGASPRTGRTTLLMGPFAGAVSVEAASGIVIVSVDGTWVGLGH